MSLIEIVEDEEEFELKIKDSTFVLRRFSSDFYQEVVKRHTTKRFRRGQLVTETDDQAVNEDLLDYMIKGWKGVISPLTKKDVECTRANKVRLPASVKIDIVEACDADSISGESTEEEPKKKETEHP